METIKEVYKTKYQEYDQLKKAYHKKANILSIMRLFFFLATATCLFLAFPNWNNPQWLWLYISLFTGFIFLILVFRHNSVKNLRLRYQKLGMINQHEIYRLERNWQELPCAKWQPEDKNPIAEDLDVFGQASLNHLLDITTTYYGRQILNNWLLAPACSETVKKRQEAVKDLAPKLDDRQQFHLLGILVENESRKNPESVLEWLAQETWLLKKKKLKWLVYFLTLSFWVSVLFAFVPHSPWMTLLLLNIAVSYSCKKQIHNIFQKTSFLGNALKNYEMLFRKLAHSKFESELLTSMQKSSHAYKEIKRLRKIVQLSDLRYHMLYIIIQGMTFWDFFVLIRLEKWQEKNRNNLGQWLKTLGEFEALLSLANITYSHPHWTFADIDEQADRIKAKAIGHPLLSQDKRVDNDIEVGPPGTFLLVTGSNMSGKSTLLRSLGCNVLLARAGGPVCAAELIMPVVRIATSMRVQDSLERGVSLFMAQLQSLKRVIDMADDEQQGTVLLYLLDEILQGTNSGERHIAVQRVMLHLAANNAIGAISTHDLTLADNEHLKSIAHTIHFREHIHREQQQLKMSFDYKLQQGPATTTNALKLLEMVGLSLSGEMP